MKVGVVCFKALYPHPPGLTKVFMDFEKALDTGILLNI
jgi:hypothetical protein